MSKIDSQIAEAEEILCEADYLEQKALSLQYTVQEIIKELRKERLTKKQKEALADLEENICIRI
jgi:hypothetical protein